MSPRIWIESGDLAGAALPLGLLSLVTGGQHQSHQAGFIPLFEDGRIADELTIEHPDGSLRFI